MIPGPDDGPGALLDNGQVTNVAQYLTDTTRVHAGRVAVRVGNAWTLPWTRNHRPFG